MTQDYTHKVGDLVACTDYIDAPARTTLGVIVSVANPRRPGLGPYQVEWVDGEHSDERYTYDDIEIFKRHLKKLQRKGRRR